MGFIEKMISEAIRRETGFNPRRLIRRVGGRNILLAGGAALAGGLLASQARSQQQAAGYAPAPSPTVDPARTSASSAASRSQAPLPPPPPAPPPAAPLPPLPRVAEERRDEAASSAEPEGTASLPSEVRYAITRTMVAAALADGELARDEKSMIDEQLAAGDLEESQVAQIRRDLVVPPSALELADTLPDGEAPELLLQFALLTTRADGELSPRERTWLQGLANALGLRGQAVEQVEKDLFSESAS